MTNINKKLTPEQKRLLIKKRLKIKNELVATHRASYITTLHTYIKDFYGMLRQRIKMLEDQHKNNMPEKLSTCIRMMKNSHINVFRRSISKQDFTNEQMIEQLQLIHKFSQSLVNKNILSLNQVTNLMEKLNNVNNIILMNKEYTAK